MKLCKPHKWGHPHHRSAHKPPVPPTVCLVTERHRGGCGHLSHAWKLTPGASVGFQTVPSGQLAGYEGKKKARQRKTVNDSDRETLERQEGNEEKWQLHKQPGRCYASWAWMCLTSELDSSPLLTAHKPQRGKASVLGPRWFLALKSWDFIYFNSGHNLLLHIGPEQTFSPHKHGVGCCRDGILMIGACLYNWHQL